MNTRDIRTSQPHTVCDVCGRTLLRGERADVYLNGGTRRSVCELCKSRALHEGWVREGTVPAYDESDSSSDRRRSLLGRLRSRRDGSGSTAAKPTLDDELDGNSWSQSGAGIRLGPPGPGPRSREPRPVPAGSSSSPGEPRMPREPRHVRAVPSSAEQKVAAAVELFNGSEHRRTVSGVARSLGEPSVAVSPSPARPSLVNIVVAWELCWYRYDVDLSDDQPSIRVSGQGYELSELTPQERLPNAVAGEHGQLSLPG
ncbi:MAG: hypothetical protein M3Z06_01405 [Actinomycetota bacterium]|nr:hypothetical protein [Actinomycetota bacterium]